MDSAPIGLQNQPPEGIPTPTSSEVRTETTPTAVCRGSFPKSEHLCRRSLISQLYDEGQRIRVFPFSVHWLIVPAMDEAPCQVMIVAPKRRFHHAVDRNRIRRLTRECYRTRKQPLLDLLRRQQRTLLLSLYYIAPELPDFHALGLRMDKLISTLVAALEKE